MGTCEVGRWLWREQQKQRQERVQKILSIPARSGGGIKKPDGNSGVIGVASKGMQIKGAPPRPPTGGHDWITPKTKAATTPTQSLYKPVSSLGVKPSVPAQPQTLYKPVTSLAVKPSVPSTPQQKR